MTTIFNCCITAGVVTLSGGMNFTLNSDTTEFTLTCNSTGGPATTVQWTRNNELVTGGNTILVNGVTGVSINTLLVTGWVEGLYKCTVENEFSSQSSAELNVKGNNYCTQHYRLTYQYHQLYLAPSPLANVSVYQNGLITVLVTWAPSEGPTITGYTITYQRLDGGENKSVMAVDTETNRIITGLIPGATYSISIVASSNTLPSTATTATITIGIANTSPYCCKPTLYLSPYRASHHRCHIFLLYCTSWRLCHSHMQLYSTSRSNRYSSL